MSSVPLSAWVQFQLWPSLVASGYHLLCLSESGSCASVCLSPRVEPTEAGDYKLCFDNSFSTISDKLVFFELIFDSLQDDEEVEGWAEAVEPEEMLDVKMEDIKVCPGWLGPRVLELWLWAAVLSILPPWLESPASLVPTPQLE